METTHLIADGRAVTSCCGRTPFELPRSERITVDPKLGNCGGAISDEAADFLATWKWGQSHYTKERSAKLLSHPTRQGIEHQSDQARTFARAAIEELLRLLALQPVVDREELRQLVAYCREREVYKGRDNEIGADTAYGDVADRLDAILALLTGSGE